MITFCCALISMSPALSIFTTLFALSSTILFFFVLSTIVTFSAPSLSSKIMRWPDRVLTSFVLFFDESLFSTGCCWLLHSAPITIGRLMSPCSNTTSTWSSFSGKKYEPRPLPAIGTAMRAQNVF